MSFFEVMIFSAPRTLFYSKYLSPCSVCLVHFFIFPFLFYSTDILSPSSTTSRSLDPCSWHSHSCFLKSHSTFCSVFFYLSPSVRLFTPPMDVFLFAVVTPLALLRSIFILLPPSPLYHSVFTILINPIPIPHYLYRSIGLNCETKMDYGLVDNTFFSFLLRGLNYISSTCAVAYILPPHSFATFEHFTLTQFYSTFFLVACYVGCLWYCSCFPGSKGALKTFVTDVILSYKV